MGKHGKPHRPRHNEFTEGESPERTAAVFDMSVGSAIIAVADKRLTGTQPYDMEPGSKPTVDGNGVRRTDGPDRRRR